MLLMLDVLFDVRVRLSQDREHLELRGSEQAVSCAMPKLLEMKPRLIAYLRTVEHSGRPV